MSVVLIAENLLTEDDFSAATEQAGPHTGQPQPDNGNAGSLRLLALDNADNEIADFSYDATATSNGEVDGTTVICSNLSMFGNDLFIGATVEITSGAYSGQTGTVSDFAQSTGALTVSSAFGGQITSGITFTLSISCATREFKAELTATGDTGAATFKWSHDGGTTYFGRNDPNQADWLGANEVYGSVDAGTRIPIVQAGNYTRLAFYAEGGSTKQRISANGGLTWGSASTIASGSPASAIKLTSGHLLLAIVNSSSEVSVYRSTNNGNAWVLRGGLNFTDIEAWPALVQMANRNILMAYTRTTGDKVMGKISDDEAASWGDAVTIANEANNQDQPDLCLAADGDVICVYRDDSDLSGDKEIKASISDDNAATWTDDKAVADFSANDLHHPAIEKDINGDLYCAFQADTADQKIAFVRSTNNGGAWGSQTDLKSVSGVDLAWPGLCLFDGHEILCSYLDATNSDADVVRRGIWETYSANGCLCPEEALKQRLVCDVGLVSLGYGGTTGDKWSFSPEHDFGASNMIADSPSQPWRSKQENIACNIDIDMGAGGRLAADAIALFGCNLRSLDFKLDNSSDYGSPSTNESISFDAATGEIDAMSGRMARDTSLLSNYKDHELRGCYFQATTGTDSGKTWKIEDNIGDWFLLEGAESTNLAATDDFVIFKNCVAKTFTFDYKRYGRFAIPAEYTSNDYYQIGSAIIGRAITLTHGFARGYQRDHDYDIEMLRTPHGGMIPIKGAERKRIFQLTWRRSNAGRKELTALLDYIEGKNICLIPDDTDMTNCFLVKLIGGIRQTHVILDRFNASILFEEVL